MDVLFFASDRVNCVIWGFGRSRWRDGRYRVFFAQLFSPKQQLVLGDNSARRAAHELFVNPGSATPEAIKRRNGH